MIPSISVEGRQRREGAEGLRGSALVCFGLLRPFSCIIVCGSKSEGEMSRRHSGVCALSMI